MTCYHPLKGFIVGKNNNTGKNIIKVTPYDVKALWKRTPDDTFHRIYDDENTNSGIYYKNYVEVPCGHCVGCRLKRSRDWANRCMLELPYHESSYFVTLTYNNDNLPFHTELDDYGNYINVSTLVKKDLQDFLKRLRKNYKYGNHLKYYACGEYGDNTSRSHYHLIIFGLKLDDLKFYKSSRMGFNYYTSEFLNKVWNKGFVVVANVSWETCAYVSRYVMKKKLGKESAFYDEYDIEPEFTCMSLKPAIGYEYFKEHKDKIYETDSISISTSKGGLTTKPPKYFDNLNQFDPA